MLLYGLRDLRLPAALFVAALLGLATFAAAASAETLRGTQHGDRLIGTARPDVLLGYGGNDYLEGRRGDDFLAGGTGADTLLGGWGADRLSGAFDGSSDRIACGAGSDVAAAELSDDVARDCEVVSRQLSRDPFRGRGAQEGTEVEPDSFSSGKVVVAAFQVGRFTDGGAVAIGFATSRDAGKSWRAGLLPALSPRSRRSEAAELVADPSVAYDAKHRSWLVATLAGPGDADVVLVSRSRNGLAWDAPVAAVRPDGEIDKSWIACDNWRSSPFRGRCYLTYLDVEANAIALASSDDGGRTWSQPVEVEGGPGGPIANGAQPLVRPDGSLLVAYSTFVAIPAAGENAILVSRSLDGGRSFAPPAPAAVLQGDDIRGIRAPAFVSGDVDASGTVYLAWQGCVRLDCDGSQILLVRSSSGIGWSPPAVVPTPARSPAWVEAFLPGLAVAPGTAGARARLAITYYTMTCDLAARCVIDAFLSQSVDGGRAWASPQRLNPEPMRPYWLAATNIGAMLGDYISTSYAGGAAIPVLALAAAPVGNRFNEAIFAARVAR